MYNDYYVYLHRRGDNNEVFYIGKGRKYRSTTKANRNQWWLSIVTKCGFTVEYVETGLSEESAYDLEIETIKFYRENNHTLCNLTDGGEGGTGCSRKVPITDGAMLDMNIFIPKHIRDRTRSWKARCNMIAVQVVIANLLAHEKVYYRRGATKREKTPDNARGLSNRDIKKAVEVLSQMGHLTMTTSSVTDSVKVLSSVQRTDALLAKMQSNEVLDDMGRDMVKTRCQVGDRVVTVYVQHPWDNRLIDVGYTFDMP